MISGERETLSLAHWGAYWVRVRDDRIVAVRPFEADPAPPSQLAELPALLESPLRIRTPSVRRGWLRHRERSDGSQRGADPFVEVDWDTALDLVAGELHRVRGERGPSAVLGGSYGWASAGRFHHARTQLRRFLFKTGGCTDQAGNYSWGAAQYILPRVIGTHAAASGANTALPTICAHTRNLFAFGGLNEKNWLVTSGGAGQHGMRGWFERARANGCRFVVISPDRQDAPRWLDAQWVPIRPGTDAALMLAMAHVLVSEGRHDADFCRRYCVGFEALRAQLLGQRDGRARDPRWAAAITGVPSDTIVDLARRLVSSRSFLTATWSLQRAEGGEQPYWTTVMLAALSGQIGLPGGGYGFGHGSLNAVGVPTTGAPAPVLEAGANPAGSVIPAARLADALLAPGATIPFDGGTVTLPDIKLIYWAGGNPFHHHQDLPRLQRGWARPETIVVHEIFWTATARRADIVLPCTTSLERDDIGGSSRDRFVFAMRRAVRPRFAARDDHAILCDVAARLGARDAFTDGLDVNAWLRHLYGQFAHGAAGRGVALPGFDEFWERGFHELAPVADDFVLHQDFRADPLKHPLATPSGRIELFSAAIDALKLDGCSGVPDWYPQREGHGAETTRTFPLQLLTRQPAQRLHSQLAMGPHSAAATIAGRNVLRLNVEDARARGIVFGDTVRVFNARGALLAAAEPTDELLPGVATIATGTWYDPLADPLAPALDPSGNPNVLTQDVGSSPLSQACAAQSCLVECEKWPLRVPDTADAAPIRSQPPIAAPQTSVLEA